MYYYKVQKNLVYKYEVNLDLIKLHKLKNEIMDNCSIITHKEYETYNPPEDSINRRNYKKLKIGIEVDNNGVREKYLVKYDEYEFSPLVHYIVDLILGETHSIEKIEKFKENVVDFDYSIKRVAKEQELIINNLDKVEDTDTKLRILASKRKELLYYINHKEINKNRISADKYKKDVLSCIKLNEIDVISVSDILRVTNFIEELNSSTITISLEKQLIRSKK